MAAQDPLQKLWLHGKAGGMAPREQLKAWALHEAWLGGRTETYGMHTWMAERLTKVGGDDAPQQPGSPWDMTLHEAAVSWIRRGLTWSLPPRPWEESPIGYARRLRAVVRDINTHYNVEGLCRELPQRVLDLNAAQGGRLGK